MKWANIETELVNDGRKFSEGVKNLAPQNSKYVSIDKGKVVDYIYVDGRRVRTNTNNLFQNVVFKQEGLNNDTIVMKTVVDTSVVPYYDKAVLSKTLTVAKHYRRTEYGSIRYGSSIEYQKENRNYLYYMRGESLMRELISKWNGKTIEVEDDIEVFR